MDWNECLKKKVFKRTSNVPEAKALFNMAEKRLEFIEEIEARKYPFMMVEAYYEVMKELITSLLAKKGYKSYSHECLIAFLGEFYDFSEKELGLIDECRIIRHDIGYRGFSIDADYLNRNEVSIKNIINKLIGICKKELNE